MKFVATKRIGCRRQPAACRDASLSASFLVGLVVSPSTSFRLPLMARYSFRELFYWFCLSLGDLAIR
jgi:hypothetical protein